LFYIAAPNKPATPVLTLGHFGDIVGAPTAYPLQVVPTDAAGVDGALAQLFPGGSPALWRQQNSGDYSQSQSRSEKSDVLLCLIHDMPPLI
jgi:hypothetical protein